MTKLMSSVLAVVFAAGLANAQDEVIQVEQKYGNEAPVVEVTVEEAVLSAYVWRGQVYNGDIVFQPQLTLSRNQVSFNIWGNYDLSDNYRGVENDLSEIDISLAYKLPWEVQGISFDVGAISYQFPGNEKEGFQRQSTVELFARARWLTFHEYVRPSVTFFGDVKEVEGTYIQFDVIFPYQFSDYLEAEGGLALGWGNTRYNDYYFGKEPHKEEPNSSLNKGWNDFNVYGNVSYEIIENLTASLNLTYTMLAGGEVEDGANRRYESKNKIWGGLNLAYDF